MTHITCRLTAKNRDQLRNPTLDNRARATFTFLLLHKAMTERNKEIELEISWRRRCDHAVRECSPACKEISLRWDGFVERIGGTVSVFE